MLKSSCMWCTASKYWCSVHPTSEHCCFCLFENAVIWRSFEICMYDSILWRFSSVWQRKTALSSGNHKNVLTFTLPGHPSSSKSRAALLRRKIIKMILLVLSCDSSQISAPSFSLPLSFYLSCHRFCTCSLNSWDLRGGGDSHDTGGVTAPPPVPSLSWCMLAACSQTGEHMCRCQSEQKLSGWSTWVLIRPEAEEKQSPPTSSSQSLLPRSEQSLSRDGCQVKTLLLGLSLSRSLPLSLSLSFVHTPTHTRT